MNIFINIKNMILKFICKRTRMVKITLKRRTNVAGFQLLGTKFYSRATVSKTVELMR
jgi:hypothetical protein